MTQPEEAVGGATNDEPVVAAEPTLEDRFAAFSEEPQEEPETAEEPVEGETAAEEPETEAEAEDDLPPIKPPVSWTAEEQEEFKTLPRALQETLTRREAEREKFVQSKAQEAKQTRHIVEQQAADWRTAKLEADARLLAEMLPQVPERPSYQLQAEDPYSFAQQMDWYESAVAQRNAIAQRYEQIQAEIGQVQQTKLAQSQQLSHELLQENFPEFFDAAKGPELKNQLTATALALGYSQDQLNDVDGRDILAMRTATEWKTKADKYDALMAKQMEKVREAKTLPRVSRPGTAPAKGALANERYSADRQAMREGNKDAAARVFGRFI